MFQFIWSAVSGLIDIYRRWRFQRDMTRKRWDRKHNRFLLAISDVSFQHSSASPRNFSEIFGTFEYALVLRNTINAEMFNARLSLAMYEVTDDPKWMDVYRMYRRWASDYRKVMLDNEKFVLKRNFLRRIDIERRLSGVPI